MKQFFFDSATLGNRTARYFLISETSGADKGEYGVLVELDGEQALIPALSFSRRGVLELLGRMCRGVVTPVTARDVAEDWLSA